MEVYVSLGIIILSGLITASLQLPLGTLLLLYHASLGKNVRQKTKKLASSFISGVTLMNFLLLGTGIFLVSVLSFSGVLSNLAHLILFGLLVALGVIAWFVYYKRKGSTELWLPRRLARYIDSRAKITEDLSEAFSLGLLIPLAEILFTLPLLLLSADAILHLDAPCQALGLVIFTLFGTLPLLVLRFFIRKGRNVAEVQRWRLRNKAFFRFFTGAGFLVLAAFLLAFVIIRGAFDVQ
ncbi:hypothetical protein IKE71_00660 [Candidatus Saccharibacteria bacterium]|nr:hypothetical protein [Candidatus Saccharibacteria bacterium]